MSDFSSRVNFVKICGVTTVSDAQTAAHYGADAIGLILADSKRRIDVATAALISGAVRGDILRVGVFRGNQDSFILDALDRAGLDAVQIHGALSDQLREDLGARGVTVIKALSSGDDEFSSFDESFVDAVLVDGPSPGSGESHSWTEVTDRHFSVPVIAAGGLTCENITETIKTVRPWGVDVSTGVESAPGLKDDELVKSFIERARSAFARGEG